MATDVISICTGMSRLLNEQRDSYGKKQAMKALEYIDQNYMNSDVTLNSVCSYLAMSTSYSARFSRPIRARPLSRR